MRGRSSAALFAALHGALAAAVLGLYWWPTAWVWSADYWRYGPDPVRCDYVRAPPVALQSAAREQLCLSPPVWGAWCAASWEGPPADDSPEGWAAWLR